TTYSARYSGWIMGSLDAVSRNMTPVSAEPVTVAVSATASHAKALTGEVAAILTPLSTVTTACAVAAAFVVLVATTWKTPEYAGAVYSPAWVTAPPFASATLQATCTVVGDNVNC